MLGETDPGHPALDGQPAIGVDGRLAIAGKQGVQVGIDNLGSHPSNIRNRLSVACRKDTMATGQCAGLFLYLSRMKPNRLAAIACSALALLCPAACTDDEPARLADRLLNLQDEVFSSTMMDKEDAARLASGAPYREKLQPAELKRIKTRAPEIEPLLLAAFTNHAPEDLRPACALVLLGSTRAIPLIVGRLASFHRMWGWEGPNYLLPSTYLEDVQYPWQLGYLALLEKLAGKPLARLFPETTRQELAEHARLFSQLPNRPVDDNSEALERHGYGAWLSGKINEPAK
jgi:hypothetical protein